jgi:acetylornithine deacetylase
MNTALDTELSSYVDANRERLVEILQDLVRIPSENRAPLGNEGPCQQYLARALADAGWMPHLYNPLDAPGIERHPAYWPGREYANRPNLAAVRAGRGGGRSLVMSGHIDTVPAGAAPWRRSPYSGAVEGNRLYGRGSNDMKAGIASHLFVAEAVARLQLPLRGDLTFESVVDEEFGGVNGTLAGRLMGYNADAAIIAEPTGVRICPAQRGGRTAHVTFRASNAGILGDRDASGVIHQLQAFLNALPAFTAERRQLAPRHPLYAHVADPVPVTVGRVHTAAWGTSEPPNTPDVCRMELFWQTMPGEALADIDAQFSLWFDKLMAAHPALFRQRPQLEHPIRWLPGSAENPDGPLVKTLAAVAEATLGFAPAIQGIEAPCDLYMFHTFGVPAALWGPRGGNTHMPDEYVELDSLLQSTKALLAFVCAWCGEENRGEMNQ